MTITSKSFLFTASISGKVEAFMAKKTSSSPSKPSPSFAIGESFRPEFEAMSAPEVQIILTLFVKEEIPSSTELRKWMAVARFLDKSGAEHSAKSIELAINSLKKKSFILPEGTRGWQIPPRIGNLVTGFAAQLPEYLPSLQTLFELECFTSRDSRYHSSFIRETASKINGEARARYYTGRTEELERKLLEAERFRMPLPDLGFITQPLSQDLFGRISPALRIYVISTALEKSIMGLTSPDEVIAYVLADGDFLRRDLGIMRAAAEARMMQGDLKAASAIADLVDESALSNPESKQAALCESSAIRAGVLFCQGNLEDAIAEYEKSMAISKKSTRKRKVCPRGLGGLFYQLALCRRADVADFTTALQTGTSGFELKESAFYNLLPLGNTLIECLTGKVESTRKYVEQRHHSFRLGVDGYEVILFAMLARISLASNSVQVDWATILDRFAIAAEKNGYFALALECLSLRAVLDDRGSTEAAAKVATLRLDHGLEEWSTFSTALGPSEPWEMELVALEQLAAKHGEKGKLSSAVAKGSGPRKEIIWMFDASIEEDGTLEFWSLHPVERSISATGNISKSRNIALKRLKEKPEEFPALTDHDKTICRQIKRERGDYLHREYFRFSSLMVLFELIGHPLVFAENLGPHPISFRRGRFRLETNELPDGTFQIRLDPPLQKAQAILIKQEGTSGFALFQQNLVIKGIAAILGEDSSTTMPTAAKERFFHAVSTFAADLDIAADGDSFDLVAAADPGLRQIEPDTTIRLRLLPEGEGLAVRMLVRPIEDSDSIFAPGGGKEIVFGIVKGERLQTRRELTAERTTADDFIAECPALRDSRGEFSDVWEWRFPNANDCLALLRDLLPLREKGLILEWPKEEPYRLHGVATTANTKLSLGSAGDWLTASGEVTIHEDLVLTMRQLLDFVSNTPRGSEFIEIGDGQFLALEADFRHYLEDMQALAQPGKSDTLKLPPLAALALEEFVGKTSSSIRSKVWKDWIERFRTAKDHHPEVPTTLQADLRSYQVDGYRWLSRLAMAGAGACLADDMGLGKTVQALALLLERAPGGPALVVAPTSVAANWLEETIKFAPTLRPIIFGATDRQTQLAEAGPFDLIISTYGLLQREEDALSKIQWHTVILDEAQAIKNSATSRSRAARSLQADFRLVTTGTPVENRLSELHTLFRFILPGYLGSWDHFRKNFADPIERDRDPIARDRLRRLIQPFLLRRLKSGVLRDLPSRTEINLSVELGEDEAAFYEALRSRAVEELTTGNTAKKTKDDPGKKAFQILAELTRLRRACCHPSLVDPKLGKTISGAKLAAFSETVDEILAGRHKVLVFSQFVDHLALIRAELDRNKISYQYLDGSTPTKKRKQAVDAFQRGEGDVFLISLKAGGFGLNLTAADYVIHMDPWWNPATEDQASDRAHRIGQTRPVTIYRLITKGTIEEKIVSLHHQKRELAESLLAGSEDANVRLSPEDLLDLIRE